MVPKPDCNSFCGAPQKLIREWTTWVNMDRYEYVLDKFMLTAQYGLELG